MNIVIILICSIIFNIFSLSDWIIAIERHVLLYSCLSFTLLAADKIIIIWIVFFRLAVNCQYWIIDNLQTILFAYVYFTFPRQCALTSKIYCNLNNRYFYLTAWPWHFLFLFQRLRHFLLSPFRLEENKKGKFSTSAHAIIF